MREPGAGTTPCRAGRRTPTAERLRETCGHVGGHEERRVDRPAIGRLRATNLVGAQRGTVGLVGPRLLRRPEADGALDDDERGPRGLPPEGFERPVEGRRVVRVGHVLHAPAEPGEPRADVLTEGEVGVPLDRDRVVVVDPAEVRKLQVARERRGLRRDALHEVAVAAEHVGVVVEERLAGTVVPRSQPRGCDRHADRIPTALAERTGGRLDAGRHVMLGVARAHAVELAEPFDRREGHGRLVMVRVVRPAASDAREVDEPVEEHRRVAAGEHESVAVGPGRVERVVAEEVAPDRVGHRREGHRRSRVAAPRRLDRIHRERAERVDGEPVDVGRGGCGSGGHRVSLVTAA